MGHTPEKTAPTTTVAPRRLKMSWTYLKAHQGDAEKVFDGS